MTQGFDDIWLHLQSIPILDATTIEHLHQLNGQSSTGSEDIFGSLILILQRDLHGYEREYRGALRAHELQKAMDVAHALKGASQSAGMLRLSALAGEMEKEAKQGHIFFGTFFIERLEPEIASALEAFAELTRKNTS
jgi:HPt (histidine-containing phosphotransfer) domain-containing protein